MVQRRGLDTGRCLMKAIVVTDEAAGTAGMTLVERPEPEPAINDVVAQVHAPGLRRSRAASRRRTRRRWHGPDRWPRGKNGFPLSLRGGVHRHERDRYDNRRHPDSREHPPPGTPTCQANQRKD